MYFLAVKQDHFLSVSVCIKYLIQGWMQSEKLAVPIGLPLVLIVSVDLFIWGTVQQMWQEGVWLGVLQIEDATGPAPPRRVVNRHGPPFQVILIRQTLRRK